jgi:hypothetical protein
VKESDTRNYEKTATWITPASTCKLTLLKITPTPTPPKGEFATEELKAFWCTIRVKVEGAPWVVENQGKRIIEIKNEPGSSYTDTVLTKVI